jgi:hypothetical protein
MLWAVLALLLFFAALPIGLRVYAAYWDLWMGHGALLNILMPPVS